MKRLALLTILFFSSLARADYLGSWKIDDYLCVTVATHRFSTGASYAATGDVLLDIYEDNTATEIVNDTAMAQFDSRTGLYQARVQLTAAAGFEKGKHYTCVIGATVDSIAGLAIHTFQVEAEVDTNTNSDKTGYGLADNAITSAKFDESTAYPITGAALDVTNLGTSTDMGDVYDARLAAVGITSARMGYLDNINNSNLLSVGGGLGLSDTIPGLSSITFENWLIDMYNKPAGRY